MVIKERDAQMRRNQRTHRAKKYKHKLARSRGLLMLDTDEDSSSSSDDDSEDFQEAGCQTPPHAAAVQPPQRRRRQSPEAELVDRMRGLGSHPATRENLQSVKDEGATASGGISAPNSRLPSSSSRLEPSISRMDIA